MTTMNPFADDNVKGEVWERGYLAGFSEPEENHFLPFSPELLAIYQQGEQAGKADRRAGLPDGESWVEELAEHGLLHAPGVGLEKFGVSAGGLIGLVLSVVTIPGDVQLQPLEPDWEGPANENDDVYVAVCGRTDHAAVAEGVTSEGYWVGPARSDFESALSDFRQHAHAEMLIARCSVHGERCGPVWPIR